MNEDAVVEDAVEEPEDDMRAVLEAQFDEVEPDDESSEPIAEAPADEAPATEATAAPEPEDNSEPKNLKAPAGWSPQARESWSKVPPEVQKQIAQREQGMAQTMQEVSGARDMYKQAQALQQSYAPVLQSQGINSPMEAAQSYVQTVSTLQNGTQEQKAGMIAEMINNFGVDIGTLDQTLVGQPQQSTSGLDPNLEQVLEQKLAPVNQLLQGMEQQKRFVQQQQQQQANSEVAEFGQKAEFLGDVRNQMADLIDMGAAQGRQIGMQEAYDMACQLNPQVKQVLDQRAKTQQVTGQQNLMAGKRNAAVSLNGRQGGQPSFDPNASLTSAIENAWNELERG